MAFIKADPLSLRRARHHAQDRPLQGLPRPLRRDRSACPPDGGDELPVQAGRQARLPCQGPDLLRASRSTTSSPELTSSGPGAELFSIGAGGSTIALTWHMMRPERGADRPSRIIVSNRSAGAARRDPPHPCARWRAPSRWTTCSPPSAADNDAVVARLKPGSLVINATGLGKDAPGSPLTDAARFPEGGIAWDLNYRGDLVFLDQARAQQAERRPADRGRLDLLHPWLDAGHRRGLRRSTSRPPARASTRSRRSRPASRRAEAMARILVTPRSLTTSPHPAVDACARGVTTRLLDRRPAAGRGRAARPRAGLSTAGWRASSRSRTR